MLITKELIRRIFLNSGAAAVGFAAAEPVPYDEWNHFESWLLGGCHANMSYMKNYPEIRQDPRLLLPDAKTLISLAFNYTPIKFRKHHEGTIASYAYYPDYHKVIRKLLKSKLRELFSNEKNVNWRICIDSAPMLERYWGIKSGIGFRGDNGMLIVPGKGSRLFLAEIILNLPFEPDTPLDTNCGHCGKCRSSCPGKAIMNNGEIDCRRCISYLTIEHRGDWDETGKHVMATPQGRDTIFGCDLCLEVCPWNKDNVTSDMPDFSPLQEIMSLNKENIKDITEENFHSKLDGTSLTRTGYEGFVRNIQNLYTNLS